MAHLKKSSSISRLEQLARATAQVDSQNQYSTSRGSVAAAILLTAFGAANAAVQIVLPAPGSGVQHLISEISTSLAGGTAGTLAYATTTLTGSSSTAPSDGDAETIGGKVYTFKTTLAAAPGIEGQVLIGATGSTDAAYTNLYKAITQTGTQGTNYWVAQKDQNVTSAAMASHNLVMTALYPGSDGNLITTTVSGTAPGSFTGATMASGAGAVLTISDGVLGTVFRASLAAIGQDKWSFSKPIKFSPGASVTVRLSAGGSGVIGCLNIPGHYTE